MYITTVYLIVRYNLEQVNRKTCYLAIDFYLTYSLGNAGEM